MPDWRDDAIILSTRLLGESAILTSCLTREHGRMVGLVRGGQRKRQSLQIGNGVDAQWQARLDDQLGMLNCETSHCPSALVMDDPDRLLALQSLCAVLNASLTERDPAPGLFEATRLWIDLLDGELWGALLVKVELGLLDHLGFGLDLTACAATGETENLIYVSPKSGRAVSAAGGEAYKERLLPLPAFLQGQGEASEKAVRDGLQLTGHFLHHRVFAAINKPVPPERAALQQRFNDNLGIPGPEDATPPQL